MCYVATLLLNALRDYGADGQLGLEPTPDEYIYNLVAVFGEVRRVLKDNGVLVLNLGDSYASQGGPEPSQTKWRVEGASDTQNAGRSRVAPMSLKPKDLMGIPWRVALALQADGWYLRSAMVWVKGNCMPESVRDRPTTAHEYVFLLAKSSKYFWDAEAIRQTAVAGYNGSTFTAGKSAQAREHLAAIGQRERQNQDGKQGRNYRTSDLFNASLDLAIEQRRAYLAHLEHVRDNGGLMLDENGDPVALMVNTAGFSGAHFAVMPTALVEPFVRAGTSEKGECGAKIKKLKVRNDLSPQELEKVERYLKSKGLA